MDLLNQIMFDLGQALNASRLLPQFMKQGVLPARNAVHPPETNPPAYRTENREEKSELIVTHGPMWLAKVPRTSGSRALLLPHHDRLFPRLIFLSREGPGLICLLLGRRVVCRVWLSCQPGQAITEPKTQPLNTTAQAKRPIVNRAYVFSFCSPLPQQGGNFHNCIWKRQWSSLVAFAQDTL